MRAASPELCSSGCALGSNTRAGLADALGTDASRF